MNGPNQRFLGRSPNDCFPPKPDTTPAPCTTSSAQTSNLTGTCGPKEWISGASAALRPQATSFLLIRGLMFLGSKPVPYAVGAAVKRVPDVLECHLMAGTADYLLKVVAQDTDDFAPSIASILAACRAWRRCIPRSRCARCSRPRPCRLRQGGRRRG